MHYIVYETVNLLNGMRYKGCHSTNDLEDDYLGSGVLLKRAILKHGKQNFQKTIISISSTIEEMIEKEAYYVDEEWVKRNDTYNLQTGGLSYGILSDKSKQKISNSVSIAHKNGLYDYSSLKGKQAWNKGLQNPYSDETVEKMKKAKINYIPWNSGITTGQHAWNKNLKVAPMNEETKEKISTSLKHKYQMQDHHLKGKEPHNKGKKTGLPSWNSGTTQEKNIICPYCGSAGASFGNMKRWHFDNCKNK